MCIRTDLSLFLIFTILVLLRLDNINERGFDMLKHVQ